MDLSWHPEWQRHFVDYVIDEINGGAKIDEIVKTFGISKISATFARTIRDVAQSG